VTNLTYTQALILLGVYLTSGMLNQKQIAILTFELLSDKQGAPPLTRSTLFCSDGLRVAIILLNGFCVLNEENSLEG
jgi:hypothetical protein